MRKRLWLQFHLWTVGFIALLTVANIASALRPFHSDTADAAAGAIHLAQSVTSTFDRSPASDAAAVVHDPALALKLQQIGCESPVELRLAEGVRQIRLQFETCAKDKVDTVVSVQNVTNNFEATVFGIAVEKPKTAEGTFVMASPETTGVEAPLKESRKPAGAALSTDYISLATGTNEIKIQRKKRLQVLKIERM